MRFALALVVVAFTALSTAAALNPAVPTVGKLSLLAGVGVCVQVGPAAAAAYAPDYSSQFASLYAQSISDPNVEIVPGLMELKEINARDKPGGGAKLDSVTIGRNLWQCRVCPEEGECNACQDTCAVPEEGGHELQKRQRSKRAYGKRQEGVDQGSEYNGDHDHEHDHEHEHDPSSEGQCGKDENEVPPGKCQLCVTTKSGTYCAFCKNGCKATLVEGEEKKSEKTRKRDGQGEGAGEGEGEGEHGEEEDELECE